MRDQQGLRQQLRHARRNLSAKERSAAEKSAVKRILQHPLFRRARRIAAYVGSKGELNPMALLEHAAARGKACYLPVLHPFRRGELRFYRWRPGDRLRRNRFDIPEPLPRRRGLLGARRLDLVVFPLLGFDEQCHRLGMGGGYYDRSFAFVRQRQGTKRPFLLGFAHEVQRVDRLPTQPWDVPLDAIVTGRRLYCR